MNAVNLNTLNVKHFGDYRDFLKSHFEVKKSQNPNWSYGMWAQRLGLKATSSLTKIIAGEREPGPEITAKMVSFFDFDSVEDQYFNDLIRLSKFKDDARLKIMLMEKMGREHPDAKLHIIEDKSFEIISNWFCMTIREMVKLQDFQESSEWIQSRLMFPVSIPEIEKAMTDLLHQGLVKRHKDGSLKVSSGLIRTTDDVASEGIKKYHEQMLDNAKTSLRKVAVEKREFTAETFTISADRLPEAKEFIRDFKAKFVRLFEEQTGDQTYQFQAQFFPLTGDISQ
jgi:uncharacterized protein (TIGR02147 family)